MPNDITEEFSEDCSMRLHDLAAGSATSHSKMDCNFTYTDANIDELSVTLGIKWESSRSIPFGEEALTWASSGTCD